MRILRRLLLLIAALLVPVYAVSLSERLEVPAQWREIVVGDSHPQVRAKLRASGLEDMQCEWRDAQAQRALHPCRTTSCLRHCHPF